MRFSVGICRARLTTLLISVLLSATAIAQSPNDVGVRPTQSYDGVNESVGLANGNLNIQLPVFSLKSRGGTTRNFSIIYNSSMWSTTLTGVPATYNEWIMTSPADVSAIAPGWQINFPSASGRGTVDKGDGALVTFPGLVIPNTTWNFATQGPVPSLNLDAWYQEDNNTGTFRYVFREGSQLFNQTEYSVPPDLPVVDRNGNRVDLLTTFNTDGTVARTLIDEIARSVTINIGPHVHLGTSSGTITYKDSNGQTEQVQLIFGQPGAIDTSAPVFVNPNNNVLNPHISESYSPFTTDDSILTSVILPSGGTYTFHYNSYYEIDKITYPDGGYTRYDYAAMLSVNSVPGLGLYPADYRQVVAKHVCTASAMPYGSTVNTGGNTCSVAEETTSYTPTVNPNYSLGNSNPDGANQDNTVTFPDGTSIQHFFMQSTPGDCLSTLPNNGFHCDSPDIGTITRAASGQIVAASTILLSGCQGKEYQHTDWLGAVSLTRPGPQNMAAQVPGNLTTSYHTTTYTSDSECRITDVVESASGAGTISNKQISYLTGAQANGYTYDQVSADGNSPYLPDLKSQEVTYDGSSNIIAQVNYSYDNYAANAAAGLTGMGSSGAVQHGVPSYVYSVQTDSDGGVIDTPTTRPAFPFSTSFIPRGNLTSKSVWLNTSGSWLTTNYSYDDAGNVIASTDTAGHLTTVSFADSWNNNACAPAGGNAAAFPSSTTSPTGLVTTSSYNSCTGSLASTTNANGETQAANYDALGRKIGVVAADNGVTATCYSDSQNQSCSSTSLPIMKYSSTTIDAQNTMSSSVQLDGVGRPVIAGLLSDPYGADYATTTYNLSGWVASVDQPHRGSPSTAPNGTAATYKYYDALGRVIQQQNPSDSYIGASNKFWGYSPVDGTATDEVGNQIKRVYDGAGRLVAVCEPGNGQDTLTPNLSGAASRCNSSNVETDYGYNALNSLISVDQHGTTGTVSRRFTYDSLSRLITAQNPETGTMTYSYVNSSGGLCAGDPSLPCSVTDARGIRRTFVYDSENRLTQKSYSDGTPRQRRTPTDRRHRNRTTRLEG